MKVFSTLDEAARLLLQAFVQINEAANALTFKLGTVFEVESAEICGYLKTGHNLAALKEDAGINRFFAKTITLSPMPQEEAALLIETKLAQVAQDLL